MALRASPSGEFISCPDGTIIIDHPANTIRANAIAASPRIGYDQPELNMVLPASTGEFFPRNEGEPPDPLQVLIPNVTPGNWIEVAWEATLTIEELAETDRTFYAQVIASFNPAATFLQYNLVQNSNSSAIVSSNAAARDQRRTMGAKCMFQLPDPSPFTDIYIRLGYTTSPADDWTVGGISTSPNGCSLRAVEWPASLVVQGGPGILVPPG